MQQPVIFCEKDNWLLYQISMKVPNFNADKGVGET